MRQALMAKLAMGFVLSKGGLLLLLIMMRITIGPKLCRALSSSARPAKVFLLYHRAKKISHHTRMCEDCQLMLRTPGIYEVLVGGEGVGFVSARRSLKDMMKQPPCAAEAASSASGSFPSPRMPSSKHARPASFRDAMSVASDGNCSSRGRASGFRVPASSENASCPAPASDPLAGCGKPKDNSRLRGGGWEALMVLDIRLPATAAW